MVRTGPDFRNVPTLTLHLVQHPLGLLAHSLRLGGSGTLNSRPALNGRRALKGTGGSCPGVHAFVALSLLQRALDMIERHRRREGRQVMCTRLREGFVAGGELDQRRLTEGGPEEADPERYRYTGDRTRYTGDRTRRHLHDRIAPGRRDARGSEDEVVAVEQVGGPRRIVGRRHDRIEVLRIERRIDVVLREGLVGRQRLVV